MRNLTATICLTIAVLLGSVGINESAVAGDIDNKGIMCFGEKAKHTNEDVAYWFANGAVKRWSIKGNRITSKIADKNYRLKGTNTVYFTDNNNPGDVGLFLNRTTLVLGYTYKRQCELVRSEQQIYNILFQELQKGLTRRKL
jgi:hypothetical protein